MGGMRVRPAEYPVEGSSLSAMSGATPKNAATPSVRLPDLDTFGPSNADTPLSPSSVPHVSSQQTAREWPMTFSRTRSRVRKSTISAVGNTNTAAVYLIVYGSNSLNALAIQFVSFSLVFIEIYTLLNLAWILGDAREYDLADYEDAYYLLPPGEDGDMVPDHKHILNQDDRFCYTPTKETNQNIFHMYYTCLHINSMTLWDLSTLTLLSLAMLEKLTEAHEELTIQGSLALVSMVDRSVRWHSQVRLVLFMSLRLLQEGFFIAVSIFIVAASKGTVQMILNSLAISFMADLDNLAWSALIEYGPQHIESLVEDARRSLCQTHAGVFLYLEEFRRRRIFFTLASLAVYFFGTIAYKDPDTYMGLSTSGAADSNIQPSLFIIPLLVVLQVAGLLFVNMAIGGLRYMAELCTSNFAIPVKWWGPAAAMAVLQATACTLNTTAIAMVDGGAGAQCAWRYGILVASLEAVPTFATGMLMTLWLHLNHRLPRCLDMALAGATVLSGGLTVIFVVLSAFNMIKQWQSDQTGVLRGAMYGIMGNPRDPDSWSYFKQVCVCGYAGNWHAAMEWTTALDGSQKVGYESGYWIGNGCPYVRGVCDNPQDPGTWQLHRSGACNVTELEAQYERMTSSP